jgi:hypothetical protein
MLAGHGIAHKDLFVRPGFEEKATVTAIERRVTADATVASKVEALRGDAVGRVEDGFEHHPVIAAQEDTEQRGLPVTRLRQRSQTAEARRREDGCGGRRRRISRSISSLNGRYSGAAGDLPRWRRMRRVSLSLPSIWGWRRRQPSIPAASSLVWI